MYVKNLLKDMNYTTFVISDINNVLESFSYAINTLGIKHVDLTYFLFTTNIPKKNIYNTFHILIDQEIIDIEYYSVCPYCLNENKSNDEGIVKCNRCRRYYDAEDLIEKFSLKDNILL